MIKGIDGIEYWTFGNGITMIKSGNTYTYTLPAIWPGSIITNYISSYTLTESDTQWAV